MEWLVIRYNRVDHRHSNSFVLIITNTTTVICQIFFFGEQKKYLSTIIIIVTLFWVLLHNRNTNLLFYLFFILFFINHILLYIWFFFFLTLKPSFPKSQQRVIEAIMVLYFEQRTLSLAWDFFWVQPLIWIIWSIMIRVTLFYWHQFYNASHLCISRFSSLYPFFFLLTLQLQLVPMHNLWLG